MPDDLHKQELLLYKSLQSYKGYIPSTDFTGEEYYYYLQYASADELEQDIVNEKTYHRISAPDNLDDDEEIVDDKIRVKYIYDLKNWHNELELGVLMPYNTLLHTET